MFTFKSDNTFSRSRPRIPSPLLRRELGVAALAPRHSRSRWAARCLAFDPLGRLSTCLEAAGRFGHILKSRASIAGEISRVFVAAVTQADSAVEFLCLAQGLPDCHASLAHTREGMRHLLSLILTMITEFQAGATVRAR